MVMMKRQIKNMLMKIFQKAVLNHPILQKMFFNISWMIDVNEWTTEYGVKVGSINDLAESPHSWDKKVLNMSPVKNGNNYRFRVGLEMFRMKTNESYSLVVELYNRDYNTLMLMELECGLERVIQVSIDIIMIAAILFITQKL